MPHNLPSIRPHQGLERDDDATASSPRGTPYCPSPSAWHPLNIEVSSKSAAEQICLGYENTYKIPLMIVNVMNAFGERQHVEKFIPLCIKRIKEGKKIYIHSYPDKKKSGTRFYIHGRNIAAAVLFLINNGRELM